MVRGSLSVVNTLQRITGHGLVEGQPKTARSRRSIALAPDVVEVLHGIRGRQIEQSLESVELWENSGYVFTQISGAPVAPDMISKDFCAIVRKAGLPHLTLHGLRHAHATMALIAGVTKTIELVPSNTYDEVHPERGLSARRWRLSLFESDAQAPPPPELLRPVQ